MIEPVEVETLEVFPEAASDGRSTRRPEESTWQRGEYVGKQGWATMPGEQEPDSKVAQACAALLMPTR